MIQVGAIAGYAKDQTIYPAIKNEVDAGTAITKSFTDNGLYNGNLIALRKDAKIDSAAGDQSTLTLNPSTTAYDIDTLYPFNNVVVTFGDGYVYHKSGKWDIASFDSDTQITLDEKFDDVSTGFDLGFAIGNNFRQDTCRFAQEWVLTTESDNGTYQVDESGFARIKMPYDYYLSGKDIVVYVNLVGDVLGATDATLRVGEAKKHTLRTASGLNPQPSGGYVVPADSTHHIYSFKYMISDTVEWYRNANLGGFTFEVSGEFTSCGYRAADGDDLIGWISDYRSCNGNLGEYTEGVTQIYIDCINTDASGVAGGIMLTDAIVSTELAY